MNPDTRAPRNNHKFGLLSLGSARLDEGVIPYPSRSSDFFWMYDKSLRGSHADDCELRPSTQTECKTLFQRILQEKPPSEARAEILSALSPLEYAWVFDQVRLLVREGGPEESPELANRIRGELAANPEIGLRMIADDSRQVGVRGMCARLLHSSFAADRVQSHADALGVVAPSRNAAPLVRLGVVYGLADKLDVPGLREMTHDPDPVVAEVAGELLEDLPDAPGEA